MLHPKIEIFLYYSANERDRTVTAAIDGVGLVLVALVWLVVR